MPDAAELTPTLPKLANFPNEMRLSKRWLLWRGDKVPYYADGTPRRGRLDGAADVGHLVTGRAAYAKLKAGNGRYAGLGFALGGGWYGYDLDHVRDPATGEIAEEVAQAVGWALNAGLHVEVSPSGTGIHMIGRRFDATPPFRNGRQSTHVEAYHSGRYFTMTGELLVGVVFEPGPVGELPPLLLPARPALRLVNGDARQPVQIDAGAAQPGKVGSGWLADREIAVAALKSLNADCAHDEWLRVGLALHHAAKGHAEGLALWEQWSATAAGAVNERGEPRYVPGHCASRWQSFGRTAAGAAAPVTLGSLIHKARAAQPERVPEDVPRETSIKPARVLPGNLPDRFTGDELDDMDIPPTRWLVADLIAPGLILLAAPPKAGKSYLALQMAHCVAAGKPFLDRETTQSKVCYFDLEQGHGLIRPRRQAVRAAHGIPKGVSPVFRLSMGVTDTAVAQMDEEIALGAKLIIIDLFVRIRDELSEDAKKNAYARDYAAITKLADFALGYPDVAIVVVHHANKGRHDEWQAKISGSYGLTGGSHTNIYLERPDLRGMDDEDKEHAKNYRTLRAQGKLVAEQDIVIEMMAAGGGWQCSKMKEWEISATLLQTKVLLLLDPRYPAYTTAKDIADTLGRSYASVRKLLLRMAQRGTIESEGQGGAGYRVRRITTEKGSQ